MIEFPVRLVCDECGKTLNLWIPAQADTIHGGHVTVRISPLQLNKMAKRATEWDDTLKGKTWSASFDGALCPEHT